MQEVKTEVAQNKEKSNAFVTPPPYLRLRKFETFKNSDRIGALRRQLSIAKDKCEILLKKQTQQKAENVC